MRVGHDELRGTTLTRAVDGGERLGSHELTEARVLETGWTQLLGGDDTADAFHVDGDEHLDGALRVKRRRGAAQQGCGGERE